jgi:hypothetical protein
MEAWQIERTHITHPELVCTSLVALHLSGMHGRAGGAWRGGGNLVGTSREVNLTSPLDTAIHGMMRRQGFQHHRLLAESRGATHLAGWMDELHPSFRAFARSSVGGRVCV